MADTKGDSAVFVMNDDDAVIDKLEVKSLKHIKVDENQIGNVPDKEHTKLPQNLPVRSPHFEKPVGKKRGKNSVAPR